MDKNNGSNATDNLHKEDTNRSHYRGAFVLYGMLSIFSIIANSLILVLIWKKRSLRTTSNTILASLAISDLLTGLVAVPMVIACSETLILDVCIAMDISNRFLAFSSVGHLILLSVDRYIRIIKPFQYPSMVTEVRLGWALAFTWVFSLMASLVQLTWVLQPTMDDDTMIRFDLGYDFIHMIVLVLVPLVLMISIYTKVFIYLRRQSNEIHSELSAHAVSRVKARRRNVNEKKTASLFIAMITVFIFGLLLYFLWAIMDDLEVIGLLNITPLTLNIIVIIIIFLRFLSALCNPLLCTFIKQDFLDALKSFSNALRRSTKV
ncbi:trace amine-associated receptor 7a-like [Stylophora pistillata]|uniref:trace amine-associated receptor 7a-like n=1 Tax=Stylophora pistillata TaxID=50429 RepID=UPI000C0466EC|nr:trace amine-associated receptor 7a-like [Stylophora pistillata]